jgi:hypothetical protein
MKHGFFSLIPTGGCNNITIDGNLWKRMLAEAESPLGMV